MPHGHDRKHVIDEMRRALGHPPAAATRTDGPALTGKRHQVIEPALSTAKPREPAGEEAAAEKPPELLLDKPRQGVALIDASRLGPERLEVIADHLMEHALRGRLRRVVWGGAAHAPRRREARATGATPRFACTSTESRRRLSVMDADAA